MLILNPFNENSRKQILLDNSWIEGKNNTMNSITSRTFSPFWNSVVHTVVGGILFLVPLWLSSHTQVADMTVSGVLGIVLKYIDEYFAK